MEPGGAQVVDRRRPPFLELARRLLTHRKTAIAELDDESLNGVAVLLAESALAEKGEQAGRVGSDFRFAEQSFVFLTGDGIRVLGGHSGERDGQQAERRDG